jgi:hypothetical protein
MTLIRGIPRAFTAKVAEDAKETRGWLGQTYAKLGWGGIPREGGGGIEIARIAKIGNRRN